MNAPASRRDYLDPTREAEAVAILRASLKEMLGDDETLLLDTIEGETGLFEIIDALLERMREADIQVEGISAVIANLEERKRRNEKSKDRDRALIEQALTVAGLKALPRPTATLSIAQRPPSLVVTEEASIPAKFWKTGAPSLDKKALGEAVKAHAAALAIEDKAEREAALAEAPAIPGATLSNGAPSLTIRTK